MSELIKAQYDLLKSVQAEVDIDSVAGIIEAYETDDLDCTDVHFNTYPKVMYAIGYLRGVAEERDVTLRQLFEEEGI